MWKRIVCFESAIHQTRYDQPLKFYWVSCWGMRRGKPIETGYSGDFNKTISLHISPKFNYCHIRWIQRHKLRSQIKTL